MDANSGKKLFTSYDEAEKAAKAMRARHNEPFHAVKAEGGWVVGGNHVRNKSAYKRAKSFADIRALFDDLAESISDDDVAEYANQIAAESASSKVSDVNGDGESWTLASSEVLPGHALGMNNSTPYLVLSLESGNQRLSIKMGGEFRRHIPLVAAQAKALIGRKIVWHTWNSARQPAMWKRSEWFYLIEPVDA